jgi:hypothetical protein
MLALLTEFDLSGYSRDPATLIFDLAGQLLQESSDGKPLLLEVHSIAPDQTHSGRIVRRQTPVLDADVKLPSLGLIPNWSVKKTRAGYSQVSPVDQHRTVLIPRARVLSLDLSKENRESWMRAVHGLRRVDATKVLGVGTERFSWKGYSFSEVVAAQNMAIATTTAGVGWDGRGTFADIATSPYMTFRRLRFTKFWVEVAQRSVDFLNQLTSSESIYGQYAFSFSLTGLPTAAELADAIVNIRNGTLTVDRAHDLFLFPKYSKREGGAGDTE